VKWAGPLGVNAGTSVPRRAAGATSSRWGSRPDSEHHPGEGENGKSGPKKGAISANGRSIIFLGCAHLNGDRYDFRPENLRALCPQCHFIYDELSRLILAQRPVEDGRPRPGRRRGPAPRRTVTSDRHGLARGYRR
jgi:hypothetical protein